MELTHRHVQIVEELRNKFLELANGEDYQRRMLTEKILAQYKYEFPNEPWGGKAESERDPMSKDGLAWRVSNTEMYVWDWQDGTTRKSNLFAGKAPDYYLFGKYFIIITGFNHLPVSTGGGDTGGDGNNGNTETNNDHKTINEKLDQILTRQEQILTNHEQIKNLFETILNAPNALMFPEYEAKIFGQTIKFKPVDRRQNPTS